MLSKTSARILGAPLAKYAFSSGNFTPAKLPDLQYDYNELEPAIVAQIMELHHTKHHQTYVNGYNQAVEKLLDATSKGDTKTVASLQGAIRFNGGGHINHSIFWTNLSPTNKEGGKLPGDNSKLTQAIKAQWGSYDNFKQEFNARTATIQVWFPQNVLF